MQIGAVWYLRKQIRKPKPTHCACCGKPLGNKNSMDHFIPQALGGTGLTNNRWPMHQKCNRKKGSRLPTAAETMRFSQFKGFCDV